MDLLDCGYIAVECDGVVLNYTEKQGDVVNVKLEYEFANCNNKIGWGNENSSKFSTETVPFVPRTAESTEVGFAYSCSFSNTNQRSKCFDLNNDLIASIINGSVCIKIVMVTETLVAAAKGKEKELVKTDDVLVEISVPMATLLCERGCSFSASGKLSEMTGLSYCQVSIKKSNIDASFSELRWRISADNDLCEFLLGCAVFRWEGAQISQIPSISWSLKSPDVLDPKAKVQPTAADLRKKYLDNVLKLITTQSEQVKFSVTIGEDTEENSNPLPVLKLSGGTLSFDSQAANAVDVESDIRANSSLWSVAWAGSASQWVYFHRSQWLEFRKFLSGEQVQLAVEIAKTAGTGVPQTEGKKEVAPVVPAEHVEPSTCRSTVSLLALRAPGNLSGSLTTNVEVLIEGGNESNIESKVLFTLGYQCSRPIFDVTLTDSKSNESLKEDGRTLSGIVSKTGSTTLARDVKAELRDEIAATLKQVTLEYLALYPMNADDSNNRTSGLSLEDERKAEFMYYLSSSGVYHQLKEKLKPRIQRVVIERYGARGRAKNPKSQFLPAEGYENPSDIPLDSLIGDLYVHLVKETNNVLNTIFETTVIKRNELEIDHPNATGVIGGIKKKSVIEDERETKLQLFERNLRMAVNAESDERYWVAEQYLLERLQLVKNYPPFTKRVDLKFSAYKDFGEFMQRRATWTMLLAKTTGSSSSNNSTIVKRESESRADRLIEDVQYYTSRSRQALELALEVDPSKYTTALLISSILLETGELERGEELLESTIAQLLCGKAYDERDLLESFTFEKFEQYTLAQLCGVPIDPLCYNLSAVLFAMKNDLVLARKAILAANKCYADNPAIYPAESTLGVPRRTAVVNLANTAIYLFEHGLTLLGEVAYQLALQSDKAVALKCQDRNLFADSVPLVKFLMKKAECLKALYCEGDIARGLSCAYDTVYTTNAPIDVCQGWLLVSKVLSIQLNDIPALIDAYNQAFIAIGLSKDGTALSTVEDFIIPLSDLLAFAKVLVSSGGNRFADALKLLLTECVIRPPAASVFLYIGICCLRMDRYIDAEDALQEANILENRNPEVWAYLCMCILAAGDMHRVDEAEKALEQAIRLGLNNDVMMRELAVSFMSIDRLVVAEDLIRRTMAIEAGGYVSANERSGSSHTRKLMADILAAQNQAAKAIAEYQSILDDGDSEVSLRISAGEKCVVLLSSLGRREEMKSLSEILESLKQIELQ